MIGEGIISSVTPTRVSSCQQAPSLRQDEPVTTPTWTARAVQSAAAESTRRIAAGEPLKFVWRYPLLQLLDDYTSTVAQLGVEAGASMWTREPPRTGDARVDAAFAALAEHLARRDGWTVPAWTIGSSRETPQWWFVTDLVGLHPTALIESPLSFRKRGVFITRDALVRV